LQSQPNKFWSTWLLIVIVGVAIFSLSLIILPGFTHDLFNWIAYSEDNKNPIVDSESLKYLSFVYGILGAIMLGWSAVFFYIVSIPFIAGERWSWFALAVPITIWFVFDSTHSIISGFWPNAMFNIGFYAVFAIPLIATYRCFDGQSNQ